MTGNEDMFRADVQAFLNDTNLKKFRGSSSVKLTGVTYHGDNTSGYYECTFEDSYFELSLGVENGVQVLKYNGYSIFDGRLADKIYGASYFSVSNGKLINSSYDDWLAAKKAAETRALLASVITIGQQNSSWLSNAWHATDMYRSDVGIVLQATAGSFWAYAWVAASPPAWVATAATVSFVAGTGLIISDFTNWWDTVHSIISLPKYYIQKRNNAIYQLNDGDFYGNDIPEIKQ